METIKAPSWLGNVAKRKWRELLPLLDRLDQQDVQAFALLCAAWETYLGAADDIRTSGRVIEVMGGRLFINPAQNVQNEAHKQILKLSKLFGLTPDGSRKRKSVEPSAMASLLEGEK